MKETLDEESRLGLIHYRLERADEAMEEAKIMTELWDESWERKSEVLTIGLTPRFRSGSTKMKYLLFITLLTDS